MKKKLFFYSVALLALSACTNDTLLDENTTVNQPKEIAFKTLAAPATRGGLEGTIPTDSTLMIAAYDATAGATFFDGTSFTYNSTAGVYKATESKYWPLTPAVINFLGYVKFKNVTGTFSANINQLTLAMTDNRTEQNDLMYACGKGSVTSSGNSLVSPTSAVTMPFEHAQSWFQFKLKAGDATSAAAITVNSITLNDVSCQGTYVVTHTTSTTDNTASGSWQDYTPDYAAVAVVKDAGFTALPTAQVQEFGNLLVVPAKGITGFTINYTINGKSYAYTYDLRTTNPVGPMQLDEGTRYVYSITLTVHEITVSAYAAEWDEAGTDVNI
jgi:hypothetical protein